MQKPVKGNQLQKGHPLARGLVGCWLLNELAGNSVYDMSGFGNHGTLGLGANWMPGSTGPVVDFDGSNDEINCGNNSVLNFTTEDFTCVTRCITPSISTQSMLFSNGQFGGTGWYYQFISSTIEFYLNTVSGVRSAISQVVSSDTLYDIVVRRKGSTPLGIFINGVEATYGAQGNGADLTASIYDARIGQYSVPALNIGFLGQIYLQYIYNRALSDTEIHQLHLDPYQMFEVNLKPEIFGMISGGLNIPVAVHYYQQQGVM